MAKLHLLPVIAFILFQMNIYYSKDSIRPGEIFRNFFNQLNTIGCILFGCVLYIRHRQIEELTNKHSDLMDLSVQLNQNLLRKGYQLCLACMIVGNLQGINEPIMNYVIFLCFFYLCIAYFWHQSRLTQMLQLYMGSLQLTRIRFILTILCIILFTIYAVNGIILICLLIGRNSQKLKFDGFLSEFLNGCIVTASISKWILAMISSVFVLTFTYELKTISIVGPTISIVENKEMESSEAINQQA